MALGETVMSDARISELYDRYFRVVPATTPELLDAAHVLRYQVYCVEHPFEDASQHPNGREIDRFDANSVHAVLMNRLTSTVVGCVRLILPSDPAAMSALPIRQLLDDEAGAKLDSYDPNRTAEISRYAVSKMLRRREGEDLYPDVSLGYDEGDLLSDTDLRRLAPHLSVGLLRGVATLASNQGITTVCAAMAPPLLRLLRRFGLIFEPLGPPIEYHGVRQPCIASCETLLAGMAGKQPLYHRIVDAAYRGHAEREP
jgi:N-acyl amino acid synthase of PEP-CTERM/exosortase system